ncbi:MAG: SDR family NAD(P)-dependent oxidoreductase [Bacteroidota bacterium]
MHYFITGCNGLVGSYIARKVLTQGGKVSAIKRKQSKLTYIEDIAEQINWYDGDVLDILSLDKGVEQADCVIHCAGVVSFHRRDFKLMFKVNVEGTKNVVNTCKKYHVQKLVHISSVAALGNKYDEETVNENAEWDNVNEHSSYGLTKFLGEQEIWRGNAEGLDVIVINPSVVIGRGEWGRSSLALLEYANSNPIFYPEGYINYIDARDLAEVIYLLINREFYNERFITSGGYMTYKKMLNLLAYKLGKKPPKFKINPFIASTALYAAKLTAFILGKPPILSKELLKNSRNKTVFSNEKIKEKLSFTFKSIEDTLDWIKP